MSVHQDPHPLDAAGAERLLGGQPVAGQERLVRLLEAMTAPAHDDELGRQQATRLAFLSVRRVPVPGWKRRLSMIKAALAKTLTVKIAVLCLVSGGTGGVALAASTGSLPDPIQRHLPGHATPSGGPSASAHRSSPPYGLLEACRRYQERDRNRRRAALQHEAELSELVAALGGPDEKKADAFCADLHRTWPDATVDGRPTTNGSASPTGGPHQSGNGPGPGNRTGDGTGNGAGAATGNGAGSGAGDASAPGASPGRSGNRTGAPATQPGNHASSGRP